MTHTMKLRTLNEFFKQDTFRDDFLTELINMNTAIDYKIKQLSDGYLLIEVDSKKGLTVAFALDSYQRTLNLLILNNVGDTQGDVIGFLELSGNKPFYDQFERYLKSFKCDAHIDGLEPSEFNALYPINQLTPGKLEFIESTLNVMNLFFVPDIRSDEEIYGPSDIVQDIACDMETGGLKGYVHLPDGTRVHGSSYYPIVELAFVVVNKDDLLDVSNSFVVGIKQTKESLTRFNPWALKAHTKSGLLARLETGEGFDFVANDVHEAQNFILDKFEELGVKPYHRKRKSGAVLMGNTIEFDHSFLEAQMPALTNHFHYRLNNVSTINMLGRSQWSWMNLPNVDKKLEHTALSDIQETLIELNAYDQHLKQLTTKK